jgi:hypothetical protein
MEKEKVGKEKDPRGSKCIEPAMFLIHSRVYTTLIFHTNLLWPFAKIVTRQDEEATRIEYMIWKDKDLTQI